jgi:hypothetical protein
MMNKVFVRLLIKSSLDKPVRYWEFLPHILVRQNQCCLQNTQHELSSYNLIITVSRKRLRRLRGFLGKRL